MMKRKFVRVLCLAALVSGIHFTASAQLQLPQPSPGASVTQTVGLTDITIEYSSPGVKDRKIFGGLVPYNQMWRTGANSATKISFSRDVTVEGTKVPKGKYSIFTIPMENEFTVILNKDINASVDSYKKEEDQLRFNVKVQPCEFRERMAFMVTNFTESKASVVLEWERTRVPFGVEVDTENQALENIDKELGRTWRTYNSAARYHLDINKDLMKGMQYVDQSLSLKDEWFNNWTKAQLLNAMGKQQEAYKYAMKAKELGDKSPGGFFFKDQVEKALAEWKPAPSKSKK